MNSNLNNDIQAQKLPDLRFQHLTTLRFFLAVLVVWSHAYPLTGHVEPIESHTNGITLGTLAVVTFFFISGFLVTMSWNRLQNPVEFVIHRIFRIWPALIAALLFTVAIAFIVSVAEPMQTLRSGWQYFWGNLPLINGIQFQIDGAFQDHPNTSVNGSLWSLEWEIFCYITLLLAAISGILSNAWRAMLVSLLVMVSIFIMTQLDLSLFDGIPDHAMVLFCFSLGTFSYYLYNELGGRALWKLYFFLAILFALFGSVFMPLAYIFAAAGIVALISFDNILKPGDMKLDLSYGVYIFAFPIQQFMVYLLPNQSPLMNFLLTMPVLLVIAYLSWTLIEKPSIGFGKTFGKRFHSKS